MSDEAQPSESTIIPISTVEGRCQSMPEAYPEVALPAERRELQGVAALAISVRRTRCKIFGGDLFAEPAWDIFLELYVTGRTDEVMTVDQLATASSIPADMLWRWLAVLEAERYVEILSQQRVLLTSLGAAKMDAVLNQTV